MSDAEKFLQLLEPRWSKWKQLPSPESCRQIQAPDGPGVYQIRNRKSNHLIQFGIGIRCQERMQSLFPKPFGKGTRKNLDKRNYILQNWNDLDYRTLATQTRDQADKIERIIKAQNNHHFNT